MKMSKITMSIFVAVSLVLIVMFLSGCQNESPTANISADSHSQSAGNDSGNNSSESSQSVDAGLEVVTIKTEGSFAPKECEQRGLEDKVFMLESKYCPHCKASLPDFKDACAEKGVEPIVLDLSVAEHREQMLSHGITIAYTPTFVFGCDYFIGARSKEFYLQALDKFLENQK